MQCLKPSLQRDPRQPCTKRIHIIVACCAWISGVVLSCAPSSNQLSSEEIAHNLATHIQASSHAELAQTQTKKRSSLIVPNELAKEPNSQQIKDLKSVSVTNSVGQGDFFSASDRMWGELALPSPAVERLHQTFSQQQDTINMVIYGDSHTQGGFLGAAIASELRESLDGHKTKFPLSQGLVTVGHPIHSLIKVHSRGVWLRQNWLYRRDQGPFGPLGIAFISQDKFAQMTLGLPDLHPKVGSDSDKHSDQDGTQTNQVTVFFHRTGKELPFCLALKSNPDAKQCHVTKKLEENESPLGQLTLEAADGDEVVLSLSNGYSISPNLLRRRNRSRKFVKKKRARIKRKYRGKKRKELLAQIKAPKYAQAPHVILLDKPTLRVFGFQVQKTPSIQVQSLGVRGATIWSPAEQNDSCLDEWLSAQNADIIAVWYGTNTAARESGSLEVYERRFRSFLKKLKLASPRAACLVILPPDFGRRDTSCFLSKWQRQHLKRKSKNAKFLESLSTTRHDRVCDPDQLINLRKRGRHRFPVPEVKNEQQWEEYKVQCTYRAPKYLLDIAEVQRKVGLEESCAVYDTLNDMGGIGSMQQWACAEPNRLAQYDLVHLSPKGYEVLGQKIAQGLLSTLSMSPEAPLSLFEQFIKSEDKQIHN